MGSNADAAVGGWLGGSCPADASCAPAFAKSADGVVLFGTTGEGTSFSATERLATVEALLKAGVAEQRMGLGAGFPAVTDSVALTRSALALGLRHVLLLPPYFYPDAPAEGIEDAFAAILDGVADDRLRATLYHIPQTSGVGVPASVAARLCARYGAVVAGLKDSSADFRQFQAFRAAAPDLAITVGNEVDIARAVAQGGAGTICGLGNIVPHLVRAHLDVGAEPQMRAVQSVFDDVPFTPALKAVLAARTGHAGWLRVRAPLRKLSDGAALTAKLDSLSRAVAA